MIASTRLSLNTQDAQARHQAFLAMLPAIRRHARFAFRRLDSEAKEDAVQEVVSSAFVAYRRLVDAGKPDFAFPTPLAMYGVRQFRAGRRVGTKSNINDISSPYAQATKDICPGTLDHFNREEDSWKEILLEDRHARPAEIATVRIDFSEWMQRLPARQRRIAQVLATGESTAVAARQFRISPGRISQIRRELKLSWDEFQGEARGKPSVARDRVDLPA